MLTNSGELPGVGITGEGKIQELQWGGGLPSISCHFTHGSEIAPATATGHQPRMCPQKLAEGGEAWRVLIGGSSCGLAGVRDHTPLS